MAEHVGGKRTLLQCENRYSKTIRYVDAGLSFDATWSEAEVRQRTERINLVVTFVPHVNLGEIVVGAGGASRCRAALE